MLIGDTVIHDGRTYTVVGFTPTSVKPAQVELSDRQTGATFWIDLPLIGDPAPQRAALRVIPQDHERGKP